MNLLIAGDLVPEANCEKDFIMGNLEKIMGVKLWELWKNADYKILNLETPLTNSNEESIKWGPHIKCNPKTINGILKMQPTCIMLSNNHILDYSFQGLKDTIDLLDSKKICWIGVGNSLNDMKKHFEFVANDKKIGIYNCCDCEFSVATNKKAGANPLDLYTIDDDLKKLKKENDYVIVIYHGGKEYYRYPSPELQKKCRKLIQFGADLVICQHTHCIGCYEKFNKGTIVYGQGNFIFNKHRNEYFHSSLLINLQIDKNMKIEYIPIVQTNTGVSIPSDIEKKQILTDFEERSKQILKKDFIENKFIELSNNLKGSYYKNIYNTNIFTKIIFKLVGKRFSKILCSLEAKLKLYNYMYCEAHREIILKALEKDMEEK